MVGSGALCVRGEGVMRSGGQTVSTCVCSVGPAKLFLDFSALFDYYYGFKFTRKDEETGMYAIIESGGKQYRITEGTKVRIEKVPGNADEQISLGDVLAVNDGERMLVGNPYVTGALVTGKIVAQGRARKVTVFKYKR